MNDASRFRPPRGFRKIPAGTLKPGGVVYFPTCKKSTKPGAEPIGFRGHGFGVFLGVVPPFVQEPTRAMLDPLLAGIGWVSFENVLELLGEEQFKLLEQKFREKYDLEEMTEQEAARQAAPQPPAILMPEPRSLVGLDGRALDTNNEDKKEEPTC